MAIEHNQPDSIDKVLAALCNATPPEGMEARIAQRLQHETAATAALAPSRLQSFIAGNTTASAWWRGAVAGAAFAALALCATLLIQHRSSQRQPRSIASATSLLPPPSQSPTAVRVSSGNLHSQSTPCPAAASAKAHPAPAIFHPQQRTEAHFESAALHDAEPLTTQERELAQLARTVDPRQLVTINPDTLAKRQEQDAADFEKFFDPPPNPSMNNE